MNNRKLRVWIDLSNTPHVLFFEPIVRELERRGHCVVLTARKFANTLAVVRDRSVKARRIGAGYDASRNEMLKQAYHLLRMARLMAFARRRRFDVAAGHMSYTQAAASTRLGIPTFTAIDYEHAQTEVFRAVQCLMTPALIPADLFASRRIPAGVIRAYDGLKEHVYLAGFRPAADVRERLGIDSRRLLVTFRPVAEHAHYGNGAGTELQRRLLQTLAAEKDVFVLVLPRTEQQRRQFEALARELPSVRVTGAPLDGPSLIFASDLVVTGGGTMLREAAVLGVPAVSVFAGKIGAVDRWLADEGKVVLVRGADDLRHVRLERRTPRPRPAVNGVVLRQIVDAIGETAECR